MSDHLLETLVDGVCTLTMNRPEARNAMSGSMMRRSVRLSQEWLQTLQYAALCSPGLVGLFALAAT